MVDVQPLPGSGSSEKWADGWIIELSEALRAASVHHRCAAGARLAAILTACARDDEADTVLMKARRDAACIDDRVGLARVEIAMAATAVVRDDDAGAEACL